MKLKQLVAELQGVQTWREPKVELEQYPTPPDVAAHMLFAADAQGDLQDALVADLGCGGAILGIGMLPTRQHAWVSGSHRDAHSSLQVRRSSARVTSSLSTSTLKQSQLQRRTLRSSRCRSIYSLATYCSSPLARLAKPAKPRAAPLHHRQILPVRMEGLERLRPASLSRLLRPK